MWTVRDRNMRFLFLGTGLIMAAALFLGGFFHFWQVYQVKLLYLNQLSFMAGKMLENGASVFGKGAVFSLEFPVPEKLTIL